jgi:hypothetical protein
MSKPNIVIRPLPSTAEVVNVRFVGESRAPEVVNARFVGGGSVSEVVTARIVVQSGSEPEPTAGGEHDAGRPRKGR